MKKPSIAGRLRGDSAARAAARSPKASNSASPARDRTFNKAAA